MRVFISYRRDDSAGFAGRLADALESSLGAGSVFRDVDDIAPGEDFVAAIERSLAEADALLVVIGRHGLDAADAAGRRRLDHPQDFVSLEVAHALQHGMRVVPVLVDRAAMPQESDLPDDIAALARRQAVELADARWNADVQRLIDGLGATRAPKPVPLDGVWLESDQLRWVFTPDPAGYRVEVFRADGGGAWSRGTAHVSPAGVEVRLDLVYSDAYHYQVQLRPAEDGAAMTGTSHELLTGTERPIELRRPG